MKLWLLRHAQVLVDPGICYGSSNVDCDTEATIVAAKNFAPYPAKDCVVWTSPSARASKLAEAVSRIRPDLKGPNADHRLKEMDFGLWEMQPWESIPRADIDAWVEAFPHYCFGGKECVQDVLDRVAKALIDATLSGAAEMIWVTHAGVIRAVQFLSTEEKRTKISLANEWPSSAPSMGEWICLEIPK